MGVIALLVGIFVAAICNSFVPLSYLLLGFLAGYILSLYLMNMFKFSGSEWVYYSIKFGSAIVLALFCFLIKKWSIALVTSVVGAFFISYFTGYSLGLLKNLADLVERFKTGEELKPADYVFFSLFIVLSILGMIV